VSCELSFSGGGTETAPPHIGRMAKRAPNSARDEKRRQFAKKARAELNRRGFADMDIDIELILRRQRAKKAAKAKKDA
jgi:hypothetical protein